MEEYINKLNMYLPIDFGDEENNEYRQYLIDTFLENCQNEKYQFALMAYHMMFMSFLYKEFWELKRFSYSKVERLCLANGNFKNIHAIFDASIIPEQTVIDQYLSLFGWHVNKKDRVKAFVDTRDKCAHASGFVQFNKGASIRYFEEVLEYTEKIFIVSEEHISNIFRTRFEKFLTSDTFSTTLTVDYARREVTETKYSVKNLQTILSVPIPNIVDIDEMGDFVISYYFAMLYLHSLYIDRTNTYELKFGEDYFSEALLKYISKVITEDYDRWTRLQVQAEYEIDRLYAIGCSVDISLLTQVIKNSE